MNSSTGLLDTIYPGNITIGNIIRVIMVHGDKTLSSAIEVAQWRD
jgi:hypothetical protein